MLHLLRLNLIVYAAAWAASAAALWISGTSPYRALTLAATVAGILQIVSLALIFFAWKWIPGFSYFVFPNIGGSWSGTIEFQRGGEQGQLPASLDVDQNVNQISLILETEDAESETVVVYPRRLSNRRFELLYVYQTRRKEGRPPPFYRYRGTAVIRVESNPYRLVGSYYTEQGGVGTVLFTRV